ncbi:MAG: fumarate hydratase [Candidatus Eisenbacteria bacterium]|uniref:Fumarate hydratase n=1 Tax=Eiseniibacteriota bacterium TaxID=2212470 RepID=A0A948RTV7_UNCEI|nr:fumarate hydratase [Candidatus Eisenbacteria bacterium]MBU2690918.1 fumarate hydratase [Candidatus Eisenbacteria bacterium]
MKTSKKRPSVVRKTKKAGKSNLDPKILEATFLEIIRRTSCELPGDALNAIRAGQKREKPSSLGKYALGVVLENVELARKNSLPLCQDTGTVTFYIKHPHEIDESVLKRAASAATAKATAMGYLRQNSVDSLTGKNSGNNLGPGSPVFYIETWRNPSMDIRLILKGGGCENVGTQYSLPNVGLKAGRDLDGVEKCILDAVFKAQGKGCGPGILGVCIGGDRASSLSMAKKQFLRPLNDTSDNKDLAKLEKAIVKKSNSLDIGPMGFGGETTVLGCKIGALNRLPASYFVSLSYMCWAYRRQGATVGLDGSLKGWLYPTGAAGGTKTGAKSGKATSAKAKPARTGSVKTKPVKTGSAKKGGRR